MSIFRKRNTEYSSPSSRFTKADYKTRSKSVDNSYLKPNNGTEYVPEYSPAPTSTIRRCRPSSMKIYSSDDSRDYLNKSDSSMVDNQLKLSKEDEKYLRSQSREHSVAVTEDVPRRRKLSVFDDDSVLSSDENVPHPPLAQTSFSRRGSSAGPKIDVCVDEPAETVTLESVAVSKKPVRNRSVLES